MDIKYLNLLINTIKLQPLEPNAPSQKAQDIKCLLCGEIFKAIPKGKVMNYKKYNVVGCARCTNERRYAEDRIKMLDALKAKNITLHDPFPSSNKIKVKVSSSCCNRIWVSRLDNILSGRSLCRPCNDDVKRKRLEEANELRYKEAAARLTGCDRYRLTVRYLSEKAYRVNIDIINPKNKKRKRSGTAGVHLDHIVPIVWCFRNNIPEEIAAHPDNLRIINSKWNAKKWSKLPNKFPKIFEPYVKALISI